MPVACQGVPVQKLVHHNSVTNLASSSASKARFEKQEGQSMQDTNSNLVHHNSVTNLANRTNRKELRPAFILY